MGAPFQPGFGTVWRPKLPERARKGLAAKHAFICSNCGTHKDLGENDRGEIVCVTCFGNGGCGFGWHRL